MSTNTTVALHVECITVIDKCYDEVILFQTCMLCVEEVIIPGKLSHSYNQAVHICQGFIFKEEHVWFLHFQEKLEGNESKVILVYYHESHE